MLKADTQVYEEFTLSHKITNITLQFDDLLVHPENFKSRG